MKESAGSEAQIPSPVQLLQLHTTSTSHVATTNGSTDYTLGTNTPGCTVSVTAHSPVDILLQDEQGRRTGFDANTGGVVNEIPGGSYTGVGSEPQTITVPYAVGTYVIEATGVASLTTAEPYRPTVATADDTSELVDQHEMSGIASRGSRQRFVFSLDNHAVVTLLSPVDITPPFITPNVSGTVGNNGWYRSDALVSWSISDAESPIDFSFDCGPQSVTADTPGITFTCTATSAGGTAVNSVIVKRDTMPPTLVLPADITAEATSSTGAMVSYTVTANDLISGAVAVQCAPSSGSTFPLGATTVACSTSDEAGNIARGSFVVTVRDTTPPSISITPSDLTVLVNSVPVTRSALSLPAPVVSDTADPHANVTDNAPATFNTGTYSIVFTATDAFGNSSKATLTLHVELRLTVLNTSLLVAELRAPDRDGLVAEMTVQLATGAPPLNTSTDAFHFQVSGGKVNLAVDLSLSQFRNLGGKLLFSGLVHGLPTDIAITPLGRRRYSVVFATGKTNLSGFANPATLTLGLGNNFATAPANARLLNDWEREGVGRNDR